MQKRLRSYSALKDLKQCYRGQIISEGKTIGGARRLTDALINLLQNYYGDVIRRNNGNIDGMMRGVQATLLHSNSTDETPRHHLCPEGRDSIHGVSGKQLRKEEKSIYHHQKNPIPEPYHSATNPIYARLGSRKLLEKCLDGYTQNANEPLCSVVWKYLGLRLICQHNF